MKIKKSKINLLDKIKWKIKYRELNSILVKDTPLMRGILKNKLIEDEYSKNKEEIANILKKISKQIPDKKEKIEEIIVQTLYKDALKEKFPNNEVDVSVTNISDIIHNLSFMLNVRGLNKEGKIIYDKLTIEDCKNKYMELETLPLLGYSEKTLKKYPFDFLKKISNIISESDLERMKSLDVESIMSAIRKDVDTSAISDFIQVCKYEKEYPSWIAVDKLNFLRDNMQYSKFFSEFIKKYERFPLNEEIHELFADTRNMDVKEKMMELHGNMEYYSELRNKYFDFEITERLNNNGPYQLSYVKDFITQKYFNIKYYDIKKIVENNKEKSFSEDAQKIIMYVNKIQNFNDIHALNKINKEIEQRNIGIDIGKVFDEIYNHYAMGKLEGCFKPEEFLGEWQTIKYKDKDVQILKLQGEDFRGNVHVLGLRKPGGKYMHSDEERRNEAKDSNPLLFSMLEGYSSNLSLSTVRDDSMAFFSLQKYNVVLGFSNLKPENVLRYFYGDGATPIEDMNYNKEIQNVTNEISYDNKFDYDELLVSRYEDTNKIRAFRKNEKRILPDYILTFKGENTKSYSKPSLNYDDLDEVYTKRILEYATTYNIPIVEMDTEKYLEKYLEKYDELFQKMKNGEEKLEMKDFKALERYRRSKSFYEDKDSRISKKMIFLEIVNDLNITQENSDTIKKIIEECDFNGSNWEEENIKILPNDVQQKTKERMKFLRKSLGIAEKKEYQKIEDDEKVL